MDSFPKIPRIIAILALLAVLAPAAIGPRAASATIIDIWVDPVAGANANKGSSRASAVRTLTEAWRRIPISTVLSSGYRIRLVAGTYSAGSIPGYMESRWGTATNPIRIEAADGAGTAILQGGLNLFDVRHLTLSGLVIRVSGDVVHCEQCSWFRIENSVLDGRGAAHETLKINQSQHVDLVDSAFSGAYENAIDFVAVQYGSITGNRIFAAEDWCIYLKGGSAEFWIEGNEIYDCGTGGFSAGQGTGFQWMVSPWLTYEAENITFIRNQIHDTWGAGMGVAGGRNILLAENQIERVGGRSHLLEVIFGGRSCDGVPGDEGRERCAAYLAEGGWGTTAVDNGDNYVRIPNRDVTIRDNVFINPPDEPTRWQHFWVEAPFRDGPQIGSNAPNPARADDHLVITGNIIRNGGSEMPLGVGDSESGCRPANPTCNPDQLLRDNDINGTGPVATLTRTPTRTATPGVGSAYSLSGSAASLNGEPAAVVRDGSTLTSWRTKSSVNAPSSGWVLVRLSAARPIAEMRWMFGVGGIADAFRIQIHGSCRDRPESGWVTLVSRSNAPVGRWQTYRPSAPVSACQVRFRFTNLNGDCRLGGVSEIRLYRPLNSTGGADLEVTETPTALLSTPTPSPISATVTPSPTMGSISPPTPTQPPTATEVSPTEAPTAAPSPTPDVPTPEGSPLATVIAGG